MNTLPALPPVVYLAGRYMTSLDMFMAKVRDVLSSTRRNALMEQEHLLALYRDGVLLAWLRTLSPTDHRAGSMAESLEKMMQQTMTDTEAKKALGNLFGAKEARVTALRFDEYLELLPECRVKKDDNSYVQNINEEIDVDNMEGNHIVVGLSFRVKKAANDVISVSLGETIKNLQLHNKGKVYTIEFRIIISDKTEVHLKQIGDRKRIHTFSFDYGWIDLGLGVKWAKCNLGAKYPGEIGRRFAWGNIVENSEDYCEYSLQDIYGSPTHDCAFAIKGRMWRMPKKEHFEELIANCKLSHFSVDGVKYYKLESKKNNKYILFRERQSFWSASEKAKDLAHYFSTYYGKISLDACYKKSLCSVRPIYVG